MAAAAQAPAEWMTLSLDVFQSRTMAGLSFVYFAVFLVTLLTVRDARRLERVAQVLVWSGVLQAVLGAVLFSLKAEYRIFFVDVSHTRMIGTYVYHNSLAGYLCMCLSIGIGLMLARLDDAPAVPANWRSRVVQASAFILGPKMRLRLLLVVMVIALVLTRSRMGNAAFFAAMLIVGSIAIVLARKTAPKTIALIASDYGLLGLGLLGALVALTLWTVLAVLARRRSSQSRSWRRKAEARDHFDGARAFGTIDGDASG